MFTIEWRIAAIGLSALGILAFDGMGSPRSATAAPVPEVRKAPKELLEKRRDAARKAYAGKFGIYQQGFGSPSDVLGWSERLLEAELVLSQKKTDRIAAMKAHLDRTREVERMAIAYVKAGGARQSDAESATYERIDAEIRIFEATGKIPPPPVYDKPIPIPRFLRPVKDQDADERKEALKQQQSRLRRMKRQPQGEKRETPLATDGKELLQHRRDAAQRVVRAFKKMDYYGEIDSLLSRGRHNSTARVPC